MRPIVHGLEAQYGDRVTFTYIDVDDPYTGLIQADLGYRYLPQFVLLDGQGNVIKQWIGPVEKYVLLRAIKAALEP